ncbi:MAG TPA: class I SAM-dependent methyltransferase [Steroidobacteraceae bacterium]
MADSEEAPDNTAVRVALWRALHLEVDAPPPVFHDDVGLKLAAPGDEWRKRPDMDPEFMKPFRASIVARARYVEDLVTDATGRGVGQYVILGAGLDSFAQRRADEAPRLQVFEVDQKGPQAWKIRRLHELGLGVPAWLRWVPVNFEAGEDWWRALKEAGFDARAPAVVSSLGVSMYLTEAAIAATLKQVATLAAGSTFVMSFLMPIEFAEPEVRFGLDMAVKGARASGTPFLSFFTPEKIVQLALQAGFAHAEHVSAASLGERYFANRRDGLRPPKNAEELLLARS